MAKNHSLTKHLAWKEKIIFTLTTLHLPYCLVINSHEHTVYAAFFFLKGILTCKSLTSSADNYHDILCCSNIDTGFRNGRFSSHPGMSRSLDPIYYHKILDMILDIVTEGLLSSLGAYFKCSSKFY